MTIDRVERVRIVAGVGLGVFITAVVSHYIGRMESLPWVIAPIAASGVLAFGLPASPLAQPWAVVGGNTLSALVGVACASLIPLPELAGGVAVSTAIALMLLLRCLHPPGAATALLMAVTGVTQPLFALFPVMFNSVLLVALAIVYNKATGRQYPHRQMPVEHPASSGRRATEADLDAVLARHNQLLDVSRDDLQKLLAQTQVRAYERRLADRRSADLMLRDPPVVGENTPLQKAWLLLQQGAVGALPVVDADRRVVGIVTVADFVKTAGIDFQHSLTDRLRGAIRWKPLRSSKPETVGEIMSRTVHVTSSARHLPDLMAYFARTHHHTLPVLDEHERLVGLISQSDLIDALAAEDAEEAADQAAQAAELAEDEADVEPKD